jgi:small subunit ribosomal protein S14
MELFKQFNFPFKWYGKIINDREREKKIKEKLKDSKTSDDEASQLRLKLQKIPLNALSVRKRNRCALTGRPRGVYRKFTLGRTKLREMAMSGLIPGLTKASW